MSNPTHAKLMTRYEREGRPRLFNAFGSRWKAVKSGSTINFILVTVASGIDSHYDSVSIAAPAKDAPKAEPVVMTQEVPDGVPEVAVQPESGGTPDVPEAPEGEQPAGDNGLLSEESGLGDVVEASAGTPDNETDSS